MVRWIPVGLHSPWFLSAEVLGHSTVRCCLCSSCVGYLNSPGGLQSHRTCSWSAGWAAVTLCQKWQAQFNPGAASVKERELEKLTAWGFAFVTSWLKSEFFLGVKAGRSYVWIILPVCAVHHCKGPVLWHLLGLVGIGCLHFRGGGRICDCTYLSIFSKC